MNLKKRIHSDIVNKDKDDNEVGESAKDEVKKESPDEDPQVKNEKETEQSKPDKMNQKKRIHQILKKG